MFLHGLLSLSALIVRFCFNVALLNMESTFAWALCFLETIFWNFCPRSVCASPGECAPAWCHHRHLRRGPGPHRSPGHRYHCPQGACPWGFWQRYDKKLQLKMWCGKRNFHKGFLISRLLSRRGRRSADERFNIVGEIEADLVSQMASNEVRQIVKP